MIWRLLYNVVVMPVLTFVLLTAGFFSEKVRRAIKGRLGEGDRLRYARARCVAGTKRVIVHCASAGELESAIPLIDELHNRADLSVILTYYSPSAISRVKKVRGIADHMYLPIDARRRMRRLLDILEPHLIIVVKHDVWPNLIWEAERSQIPIAVVNAYFRPDSALLNKRILIPFARELHSSLTEVDAVTAEDAMRFRFLTGPTVPIQVSGDSRFDRVRERALARSEDQGDLREKLADRMVFVAGSTWPTDEHMMVIAWREARALVDNSLLMLVPHEPAEEHMLEIERKFSEFDVQRLSRLENDHIPEVLVVDKMGILAGLYGLGAGAYVGGGFGAGVHSVIEAAVFGIPVAFGPNNGMSHEARELLLNLAAMQVDGTRSLSDFVKAVMTRDDDMRERGKRAGDYVGRKKGASERIATRLIDEYLS